MAACRLKYSQTKIKKEDQCRYQEEFTLKCFESIKEAYDKQNLSYISRTINLLLTFFDRFEGKKKIAAKQILRKYKHTVGIKVTLLPEKTTKLVKMSYSETLEDLKLRCQDPFGLSAGEMILSLQGIPISSA